MSEFGRPLERLSYDLPFALRGDLNTDKVAIVYLDEAAAKSLGQRADEPWDRRVFARLLDRLRDDGAPLVCFDLIFSLPSADPAVDEEFARAMTNHGGVILAGDYAEHEQFGVQVSKVEKATPVLRAAEAGWGLAIFRPLDPDGAVRQLCSEYQNIPTMAMIAAARLLGDKAPKSTGTVRWLNYYGPSGKAFDGVAISDALRADGVPPGFFRGRTVFVGGRYSTGSLTTAKDEFGNPYSRWGRRFSPGVEIHATAFQNLVNDQWLRRLPSSTELTLIAVFGLVAGSGLTLLRPNWALATSILIAEVVFAGACFSPWRSLTWFPWATPLGIQLPLALGWSVGAQYFFEQRRRNALRRAFACYLSPEMADRISDSKFDLTPGGSAVEATVLFTDLENFTTLSEKLEVERVSEILIAYFTETTQHILQNKGTIIKYIGDAVMATWNVPLTDPKHAQHAIMAAWSLGEASKRQVCGYTLRTRVGIHTGRALAGNLGSPFRFDYTVIGDTTNFANRLEGMNKYLGTQILLSEATAAGVDKDYVLRPLGKFVVKGKTLPVGLFELLGPKNSDGWGGEPEWYSLFCKGVEAFAAGDLDAARTLMEQALRARKADGPAEFYLRQIAMAKAKGHADGLVRMEEK